MSFIVRQMEFSLESQSIALIINACAKVKLIRREEEEDDDGDRLTIKTNCS